MERKETSKAKFCAYTTLMIVFGPLAGLMVANLTGWNVGLGLALGLALGITLGSLMDHWVTTKKGR